MSMFSFKFPIFLVIYICFVFYLNGKIITQDKNLIKAVCESKYHSFSRILYPRNDPSLACLRGTLPGGFSTTDTLAQPSDRMIINTLKEIDTKPNTKINDSSYSVNKLSIMESQTNHVPHIPIRNRMARALYEKLKEDEKDNKRDHSYRYHLDRSKLKEYLQNRCIEFTEDQETQVFLSLSKEKSDWLLTQVYHVLAKSLLSWFLTNTSINGLLNRGSMFVYSTAQFQSLLEITDDWVGDSLLDIGAGDGLVTMKMSKHFKKVYATEVSTPMIWKLQQKNITVLNVDDWHSQSIKFDVISCLNVLDRCNKPVTLLHQMKDNLKPTTGRLVVAVVLPFKPYVESVAGNKPEQCLVLNGTTFEDHISSFAVDVFEPAGLEVEKITKLPYLCEGDMEHSYYTLNDAVFVLKAKS